MRNIQRLVTILTTFALFLSCVFFAGAHSGRTDGSGGHRDNKNKSGLGSYHYHCGGHPAHLHDGGVCPYASGSSNSSSSYSSQPVKKEVSSITIAEAPKELIVGQVATCTGTAYPSDAEDRTLSWTSGDEKIAAVSPDGAITAFAVGETTITATAKNGVKSSFTVKVNEIPVSKIAIINAQKEMTRKDEVQLKVSVEPENATDKSIVWSTSDKTVATITSGGQLTALSAGKATITAKNRNFTTSFDLAVKEIEPSSIRIKASDNRVERGGALVLSASVSPDDAYDKTVQWITSDENVATIKDGTVTGVNNGKAIITAKTINGKSDSIEIEVYSNTWIYITVVTIIAAAGGGTVYYKRKKKSTES